MVFGTRDLKYWVFAVDPGAQVEFVLAQRGVRRVSGRAKGGPNEQLTIIFKGPKYPNMDLYSES